MWHRPLDGRRALMGFLVHIAHATSEQMTIIIPPVFCIIYGYINSTMALDIVEHFIAVYS